MIPRRYRGRNAMSRRPVSVMLFVSLIAMLACNAPSPNSQPTLTTVAQINPTPRPTGATQPASAETDTPAAATTEPPCEPNGRVVLNVTIPNDTPIPIGATFVKTWLLSNTGT